MNCRISLITLPLLIGFAATAQADPIIGGNVTTVLGPDFFFDTAATGGNDFTVNQPNAAVFDRNFGIINVGAGGSTIRITGMGWASLGNASLNDAGSATVTITYLGLDGVSGGGDDVLVASVGDTFTYAGAAGEYVWAFNPPLTVAIDGLNSQFRIVIAPSNEASNGSLSFKTTSGSVAANVKLSVAGTSTPIDPFPDTDADGIPDMFETNTGVYVSTRDTGTNPAMPDTDSDGYRDGVENNTGIFVSTANTGTSPVDADYDNDGLLDGAETNSGVVASAASPGTSPITRDRDNDRLSDKFEASNGLDPFVNADFDGDGFPDALEVLFYGSSPKNNLSFPGDGISPAPGSFPAILDGGSVLDLPGTLVGAVINEAALGGSDFDYPTGNTDFVLAYPNAFPVAGTSVSITGFAWPVSSGINANGDILLQFFDPGADGVVDGIDQDLLVGTAKGTLRVTGTTTLMYWNFPPVNFVSTGTGLMVKIQSTAGLRFKAQDNNGTGQWYRNDARSRFGNVRTSRFSLGGSIILPNLPRFLSLTRSGNTTDFVWDLNGASSVTLQRSTTLGGFTNVPGRTNTTSTTYQEISPDPQAFFRLAVP